jgi:hypothetical protein
MRQPLNQRLTSRNRAGLNFDCTVAEPVLDCLRSWLPITIEAYALNTRWVGRYEAGTAEPRMDS